MDTQEDEISGAIIIPSSKMDLLKPDALMNEDVWENFGVLFCLICFNIPLCLMVNQETAVLESQAQQNVYLVIKALL